MQVGLDPGHIVLDGDPSPPKGAEAHSHPSTLVFSPSAHICCRKMAGWIKMTLGREIGLGPSDIVLDW